MVLPEYELGYLDALDDDDDDDDEPWPYVLKTTPGFRIPMADECLSSEFQSVLLDDELDLSDILRDW